MSSEIITAKLTYFAFYLPEIRIGFGLPIFCRAGDKRNYIQIVDELANTISHFRQIEDLDAVLDVKSTQQLEIKLGDAPIYIFIDASGRIIIGQISDISDRLSGIINDRNLPPGIRLQIAELIGSQTDKTRLRQLVGKQIRNSSVGSSSTTSFYRSIYYQERRASKVAASRKIKVEQLDSSVDRLLDEMPILEAHETTVRHRLTIEDKNDLINIEESQTRLLKSQGVIVAEINVENRDSSVKDVIIAGPWRKNKSEITTSSSRVSYKDVNTIFYYQNDDASIIRDQQFRGVTEIKEMTIIIIATKRQEDRIALLLSYIIFRENMWHVLLRGYYFDRGWFARMALGIIKKDLLVPAPDLNHSMRIVKTLDGILKLTHLQSKGRFLVGIAKYMGRYAPVRDFLTNLSRHNTSNFLSDYYSDVDRYIS